MMLEENFKKATTCPVCPEVPGHRGPSTEEERGEMGTSCKSTGTMAFPILCGHMIRGLFSGQNKVDKF